LRILTARDEATWGIKEMIALLAAGGVPSASGGSTKSELRQSVCALVERAPQLFREVEEAEEMAIKEVAAAKDAIETARVASRKFRTLSKRSVAPRADDEQADRDDASETSDNLEGYVHEHPSSPRPGFSARRPVAERMRLNRSALAHAQFPAKDVAEEDRPLLEDLLLAWGEVTEFFEMQMQAVSRCLGHGGGVPKPVPKGTAALQC